MASENVELRLGALLQEWATLRPNECQVISQQPVVLFMQGFEWSITLDFNKTDQAKLQASLQEQVENKRGKVELVYDVCYQLWIVKVALSMPKPRRTAASGTIFWARGEAQNKVSALAFLAAYIKALKVLEAQSSYAKSSRVRGEMKLWYAVLKYPVSMVLNLVVR